MSNRYVSMFLGTFALFASGAGLLISGILPYTGGSAFLCVLCLTGAEISLGLLLDPPARMQAKARQQEKVRDRARGTSLAEGGETYGTFAVTPVQKPESLPVCTVLPVSAGGLPGVVVSAGGLPGVVVSGYPVYLKPHVCGGKLYDPALLCPVHGAVPGVIGGSISADEFVRQVAAATEASYVPDGSAELQANLAESLRDQAAEGVKGSHWEMNAEWAAEVKKLPKSPGYPSRNTRLWEQRTRVMPPGYPDAYLLGFPVRVSDAYGAPDLVAR